LRVIPPLEITSARLTSSTVAEPDTGEALWVAATSYALDAVAIRATTHRKYQNLQAGIDAGLPEDSPLRWLDIGPTNRFAMFDLLRNSQTVGASPLTVVLAPGKRITALALIGMEAQTVTVTMTVGAEVVYTATKNLYKRLTTTWTQYFFGEFRTQKNIALFDLPLFSGASIAITLASTTGTVKCGGCVIGSAVFIGEVQHDAESDELNFSKIDRTTSGTAILQPRRSVPKTQQALFIGKELVNQARDVRSSLNAVPAVWSGLDDPDDGYFDALLILGIYKQFTINLAHPETAKINLTLEEI
jgi:hypothetical protein